MTATKHFTSAGPNIEFTIDDDQLEAYGQLSAEAFAEFATKLQGLGKKAGDADADSIDMREQVQAILGVVEMTLTPESVAIVSERLKSREKPITFPVLLNVMNFILEEYELSGSKDGDDPEVAANERPTPPTPDSPTGSSDTGVGSAES